MCGLQGGSVYRKEVLCVSISVSHFPAHLIILPFAQAGNHPVILPEISYREVLFEESFQSELCRGDDHLQGLCKAGERIRRGGS